MRGKDLRPLKALAIEVNDTPTRVHNLEIAEAHTYFAGELEAWRHNARKPSLSPPLEELKNVTKKLLRQQGGCISDTQFEYIARKAAMYGVSSDEVRDDRGKPHWKPKGTPVRHCHLFGLGPKGHIPMTQQ